MSRFITQGKQWLGHIKDKYRQQTCGVLALLLLASTPTLAADASTETNLNQISVHSQLLAVINQALTGPRQAAAALDFQKATSDARAAMGDLQSRVTLNVQTKADSPHTATQPVGVIAGPAVTLSLPTGQGLTELTVGAAVRTGYTQSVGGTAALTTRVPLFAGPDTRLAAAQQTLATATATLRSRQRQLVVDTIAAYNTAIQAAEALDLATRQRQYAEQEYALGQEQNSRGIISSIDLLRLRATLNAAQDAEIAALHALEESRATLADLLGTDVSAIGQLTENADQTQLHVSATAESLNPDAWVALALQNRADLQNARQALKLAQENARKAQSQAHRDIAFVAGAVWPKDVTATSVDMRTDISAAIQATFYLQNPRHDETVVAAETSLAQAQLAVADLERQIARAIPAAINRITEAEQALAQASAQLSQDELALLVLRDRLDSGLAVQREVTAQQLAVAQQTARVHKLAGQRVLAYVTLWHTAGLDIAELQYRVP